MKRIMIIGCPGSGKSTFSRALNNVTGIPLFHLDNMYWNADKTTVPKTVFKERLYQTIKKETWIIDGNYGSTLEIRLQACDTVFFLDYPLDVCLDGIMSRRGKVRTDMPWVELENDVDEEFIRFVKDYNTVSRPTVVELLSKYADKDIYIFKNRKEANIFIEQITL